MKSVTISIRNKRLNILLVFILICMSLVAILYPLLNMGAHSPLAGSEQDRAAARLVEAILGSSNAPKRTLVLLANNNEIRIGGGFVGTVGLLRGDGKKIAVQGIRSVYYYDHRIEEKGGFLYAPEYMNRFASDIRLANSLRYPLTKSNLADAHDIYARETGIYVDNVVEITPDLLNQILSITGPIWLSEYEKEIRSDNLLETIQLEIEAGKDRTISGKDPKSILSALSDALLARMFSLELDKTRALAQVLKEAASGKGMRAMLGFDLVDRDSPTVISDSDETTVGAANSLLIAVANLDAGKGSGLIRQENNILYKLNADGSNLLDISITRRNTADKKMSYIDPRTGGGNDLIGTNVSSVQMFLPLGAIVMSSQPQPSGTIDRESTWAVYRHEMTLPISSEGSIRVSFDIPKADSSSRSIKGVKHILFQFGAVSQRTRVEIQPPPGYKVSGKSLDSRAHIRGNSLVFDLEQSGDLRLPYEFEQE